MDSNEARALQALETLKGVELPSDPLATLSPRQAALLAAQAPAEPRPAPAELEVLGLLGEGGMGRVELARQASLAREVAVKSVRPDRYKPEAEAALLDEARCTGRLEHPNIVPVHLLAPDAAGRPRLVMKRLEGASWRELLRDPDHPLWATLRGDRLLRSVELLIQVCNALHFAHSRGVIHRDVKPANVMVGAFGEVYLLDWGIAVELERRAAPGAAVLAGTPGYLAPEMLEGATRVDARTDVYLLGATLHEVLTGHPRHRGKGLPALLEAAGRSEPFAYGPEVPEELAALCNRACAREPAERPESALAFRHALEDYLLHQGSRDLARAAEQRLAELGAAPEEAAQRRLGAECRFGFQQALHAWPGNAAARRGLQACLERLLELELERGNLGAADQLHAELPEPRPALAERLAALRRLRASEAEASARLRELEYQRGVGADWRQRSRLLAAGSTGLALLMLGLERVEPVAALVRTASGLRDLVLGLATAMVCFSLVATRLLARTQANRTFLACARGAIGAMALNHLLGAAWGEVPGHTLARTWLLFGLFVLVFGLSAVRLTLLFLPGMAVALLLALARPEQPLESLAALLALNAVGYALSPRLTREGAA